MDSGSIAAESPSEDTLSIQGTSSSPKNYFANLSLSTESHIRSERERVLATLTSQSLLFPNPDAAIIFLVQMRNALKISQAEVGSRIGLTQSPIGSLENAPARGRDVTFDKLQAYARGLGFELTIGIRLIEEDECP